MGRSALNTEVTFIDTKKLFQQKAEIRMPDPFTFLLAVYGLSFPQTRKPEQCIRYLVKTLWEAQDLTPDARRELQRRWDDEYLTWDARSEFQPPSNSMDTYAYKYGAYPSYKNSKESLTCRYAIIRHF